MKTTKLLISFLLLFLGLTQSYGQENLNRTCGFDHQHQVLMESNPLAKDGIKQVPAMLKSQMAATERPDKYVIPVVFHVFGTNFNNNSKVTYDVVKDALDKTNKDYQGLTADYHQTDPSSRFEQIKKALNIEFRLAKIDPSGRPTTGVMFYPEKSGFGNGSGYDAEIQKYAWDNTKYMNVYIMRDLYNDGDFYNSGVAWLPNSYMTRMNTARVVYNGSYLGRNTDENFRRVLTHEFGHFFGLHHTFNGGCTYPNDEVEDTPPVATSHWPKDDLNCEGNYTDWENFMNYSTAYRHFTAGQVELMEWYLNQPERKTLWQEANLVDTGVDDDYVPVPAVVATSSSNGFWEVMENDGNVEGEVLFSGSNGRTFAKGGKMVLGTDYTVTGLPAGLTPELTVQSETKATLKLNGTADNHMAANSNENVEVVLKAAMLSGEGEIKDEDFITKVMFYDPYVDFCMFDVRWSAYAHIKKVEFAGMVNESEFDGEQYKDFRNIAVAGFDKAGETYTLKATVENWDSGASDPYLVRLWIDWNGDFILSPSELIGTKRIARIGNPGTTHEVTFDVDVPEDFPVGKKIGFRIMLHYELGNDGVDPCGMIDSGDVEDYSAWIGEAVSPEPQAPEACWPEFSYRPYAHITNVALNGMQNNTAANQAVVYEDFTDDKDKQVTLEKGQTYSLDVTYKNIDSSNDDPYILRAYVDWNGDGYIAKEEGQKITLSEIGSGGTQTFSLTVPEDAPTDKELTMRVFIHYGKGMAGEEPCGTVENGQLEEYTIFVKAPTNVHNPLVGSHEAVYPNPTNGLVNINEQLNVSGYTLYSVDGKVMQKESGDIHSIDISTQAKGMYILRLHTEQGEVNSKLVLE